MDNHSLQIQAEKIIKDHCFDFESSIEHFSEIGPYSHFRTDRSDFPIFYPGNKEYFQYRYMENLLEAKIRSLVVYPIFNELLSLYKVNYKWLSKVNDSRWANNETSEERYPVEFIVKSETGIIGYRYCGLASNEIDTILLNYNLDYIEIIDWEDTSEDYSKECLGISNEKNQWIKKVSLRHFFSEYFQDYIYNFFVKNVRESVSHANKAIGIETIPQFSLKNLSEFRKYELNMLSCIKYHNMVFETRNTYISTSPFNAEDYAVFDSNYIDGKMYCALLGSNDFAKSFLTAEYMYQIFNSEISIDYTAIICGYLKSVEQLLYTIIKINLEDRPSISKKIDANSKKSPKTGKRFYQVDFIPENEPHFNKTLGSLIRFLKNNDDCWLVSEEAKSKILGFLSEYRAKDRNGYFHKDNITDISEVHKIRNNTLFLMYLILGGCHLSNKLEDDYNRLGMIDESFESLYRRIKRIPQSVYIFYLQYSDNQPIKAFRLFDQENPRYDSCGSLQESNVKFLKIDESFSGGYEEAEKLINDNNVFVLDKTNIPSHVWYVCRKGTIQIK